MVASLKSGTSQVEVAAPWQSQERCHGDVRQSIRPTAQVYGYQAHAKCASC
jgi:hypothetical protein